MKKKKHFSKIWFKKKIFVWFPVFRTNSNQVHRLERLKKIIKSAELHRKVFRKILRQISRKKYLLEFIIFIRFTNLVIKINYPALSTAVINADYCDLSVFCFHFLFFFFIPSSSFVEKLIERCKQTHKSTCSTEVCRTNISSGQFSTFLSFVYYESKIIRNMVDWPQNKWDFNEHQLPDEVMRVTIHFFTQHYGRLHVRWELSYTEPFIIR